MEDKEKITKRIKQFMGDKKITQKSLGEKLNVTQSTISDWINDDPGEKKLLLVLKHYYSLSPDWLLHGQEPMCLPPPQPEYSDSRQAEINEAYEFVQEPGKERIHNEAMKQREEEEGRLKKQAEYERQHRDDVKRMMEEATLPQELIEIPIAGYVQAGVPTWTEEIHEGTLSWDRSRVSAPNNVFWLRIQGTSMVDCGMYPEDAILCDTGVIPRKGDAVIAKVEGAMTVKKYRRYTENGKWMVELTPCNDDFKTLSYSEEEVEIVAVVIANDWRLKRGEEKTWRR